MVWERWTREIAGGKSDATPNTPAPLYTVEYEELRAGQAAGGTSKFWFRVVETFSSYQFSAECLMRASARFDQLRAKPTIRDPRLVTWKPVSWTNPDLRDHHA